jgi:bisphosphoglycerate-independent phosphoglycerate mutase (AlkP superfamily)
LYEQALAAIAQKDALIAELQGRLNAAERENRSCRHSIKKACDILMDTASGKERIYG